MKKVLTTIAVVLAIVVGCDDKEESTVAVTGVTVSPATQTLTEGETQQFTADVTPADATDKSVTWTSNSTAVATVSNTGLVTAVAPGTATITVTTTDGNRTASVAVTVELSTEAKAAALATALGNAAADGTTVTLTGDVSTTDVTVPADVTLVVPADKTLTASGTLTLNGTINVAGIVDVSSKVGTGTVNMENNSKSKGLVVAPATAATGWIWKFEGRLWSDAVQIEACNVGGFTNSNTEPKCGVHAIAGVPRYYYNWVYVDQNKNNICTGDWKVPANDDCPAATLPFLVSEWGYNDWYGSGAGTYGRFWTTTVDATNATNAYRLGYSNANAGVATGSTAKTYGFQVRCVNNQ